MKHAEEPFNESAGTESAADLQLGQFLREYCSSQELRHPDFFSHELMRRIAADQAASQSCKPARISGRFLFLSLQRMAGVGALCLLIALLLFAATIPGAKRTNPTASQVITEILNTSTDDPAITASSFNSKNGHVAVIWLDGLTYLPEEQL